MEKNLVDAIDLVFGHISDKQLAFIGVKLDDGKVIPLSNSSELPSPTSVGLSEASFNGYASSLRSVLEARNPVEKATTSYPAWVELAKAIEDWRDCCDVPLACTIKEKSRGRQTISRDDEERARIRENLRKFFSEGAK